MNEETSVDKATVFIDGNNLYHRLKERGWRTWIDVGQLAKRLVGNRTLTNIYYYNAYPPAGKPHTRKGNAYLSQVKKTPNLIFRPAWLLPTLRADEYGSYQSHREKGADTALSSDLVSLAAADKFDTAIIVSSDGDYAPAAGILRDRYRKSVEVVYFEGSKPFAMESCSIMRAFRLGFVVEYAHTQRHKKPSKRYKKRPSS